MVYVRVCALTCACLCALMFKTWKDQRLPLSVFLDGEPLYLLRQGLLLDAALTSPASLCRQFSYGFPVCDPKCQDYRQVMTFTGVLEIWTHLTCLPTLLSESLRTADPYPLDAGLPRPHSQLLVTVKMSFWVPIVPWHSAGSFLSCSHCSCFPSGPCCPVVSICYRCHTPTLNSTFQ